MASADAAHATNGLLPKDVTRVSELIATAGCDGKGVVVAVLDTGVDPGAAGLRLTSDGKTKLVDIVDCTGSGDVDMSTVVSLPENEHCLTGLSGRKLKLGDAVRALNPSGKYHLGVKQAYELFPGPLVRRLKKERRKKWDEQHRSALNDVRSRLAELRDADAANERAANNLLCDEYAARQAALLAMEKNYDDASNSPIYDCVVFHDGENWRAVVDATERGELGACAILEDYHIRHNFAEFGDGVMMNYGTNIYNDGNILSIVVDGGYHGTHVAGILAANYPEAPEMNGLAPGAQIVSLKIGDSRLASMETHQGLIRALAYLLDHSVPATAPLGMWNLHKTFGADLGASKTSGAAEGSPGEAEPAEIHQDLKSEAAGNDYAEVLCPEKDEEQFPVNSKSESPPSTLSRTGAPDDSTDGPKLESSSEDVALGNGSILRSDASDENANHVGCGAANNMRANGRPLPDTDLHSLRTPAEPTKVNSPSGFTIDVVNMSFGEHTRDPDKGRFVELVNKLVHKHNVLFLSSAGNEGPALTSVSAPGGTTEALMGVGAYVTPAMLRQAYSLLDSEFVGAADDQPLDDEKLNDLNQNAQAANLSGMTKTSSSESLPSQSLAPVKVQSAITASPDATGGALLGIPYTWSSRGPVSDGALGVSICAPGGAIAPVPLWMLRKKMLLNGTSMASPSAAGAVAVILSFLKARGMPYTSALVRKAVENSARPLCLEHLGGAIKAGERNERSGMNHGGLEYYQELVFAGGHGSIDAFAACQYLERCISSKSGLSLDAVSCLQRTVRPTSEYPLLGPNAHESGRSSLKNASRTSPSLSEHSRAPNGSQFMASEGFASPPDSSVFLEDWVIRVRVADGSPGRRGSNVPGSGTLNTTRGIYLRGQIETNAIQRVSVTVEAIGQDEDSTATKAALANLEISLTITCGASWVRVPTSLLLLGGGRSFPAVIDPSALVAGRAHYTEIIGCVRSSSTGQYGCGPVFRVPISVLKPESLVNGVAIRPLESISFAPGAVVRRFYEPPLGATYGVLRVVAGGARFAAPSTPTALRTAGTSSSANAIAASGSGTVEGEAEKTMPGSPMTDKKPDKSMRTADSVSNTVTAFAASSRTVKPEIFSPSLTSQQSATCADSRQFEAHIVQVCPQRSCGEVETRHYFTLRPGAVKESVIRVSGGITLELCLAQMWSSPGLSLVERVELIFCGLQPEPSVLHASAGAMCFPRVQVSSSLPPLTSLYHASHAVAGYSPRGSLSRLQRVVSPVRSKISSLGLRDFLPAVGPISQLFLEYKFEVFESSCDVRIRFSGLNRSVYESELEGGPYVIVHDLSKRFVFASDIYPSEHSLQRGVYFAHVYARHDRVDYLERLQDLQATIEYRLSSEISLEIFESAHAAAMHVDSRKISTRAIALEPGEHRAFYFGAPKKSLVPKWAAVGDLLVGKMTLDKLLSGSASNGKTVNELPTYPILYSLSPAPQKNGSGKSSSSRGSSPSKPRTTEGSDSTAANDVSGESVGVEGVEGAQDAEANTQDDETTGGANDEQWLQDAIRKLKLKRLRCLLKDKKLDEFDKLCNSLTEQYSDDLEILLIQLERFDRAACRTFAKDGRSEQFRTEAEAVVTAADNVIARIDVTALAAHFGMMINPESPEEATQRKDFEAKRGKLIVALFRKTRALCNATDPKESPEQAGLSAAPPPTSDTGPNSVLPASQEGEAFEKSVVELGRWISLDGKGSMPSSPTAGDASSTEEGAVGNEDLMLLAASREVRRQRYGVALRLFDTYFGPPPTRKLMSCRALDFRRDLLRKLGWSHTEDHEMRRSLMKFPQKWASY